MLDRTIFTSGSTQPIAVAALAVAALGAATILGAWYFEFVLGLQPCPLCLTQRIPYYVGIPLALAAAIAAWGGAPRLWSIGALVVVAGLMLWGGGLGVYHSGIEWKWWPGPLDCAAPPVRAQGDLLTQLRSIRIVRCDEAPWRFLGLSLAGYNVLISLALAAIALAGVAAARSARR